MKYYLRNNKNENILSFTMTMFPQSFAITNAIIINNALLPNIFCGVADIEEKLGYYFDIISNKNIRDYNLYELDDYIVKKLNLSDRVKSNGRLYGMQYLVCYTKSHFKDIENKLYVTPDNPQVIGFFSFYGWDKLILDTPVDWEDLQCF